MKWHCVEDKTTNGFCTRESGPDWTREPEQAGSGYYHYGECKLRHESCGYYKTSQQLYEELPTEERERISKSTYVERIIPAEKPKELETKKPKGKKAKELEAEIMQGRMF